MVWSMSHLHVYKRLLTNCLHGKAVNYVWLTTEITVQQLQNTSRTLIPSTAPLLFQSHDNQKPFTIYQHFDQHLF